MQFERRACVLHPIGEISRISSGRCADKSMISAHSGDGDRRIRDRDRVCQFEGLRGSEYRLRG
jgi:hypothetical protein